MMIKRIFAAFLGAGLLLTPITAAAATDPVYTSWRDNVAAGGYDVVSFFSGKPQEGKVEFSTLYEGADWYFSNQSNKDLFLTNPEQFAPQYGGYCAWAIASGKFAKGNPKYWHVEDGRLYFNYNKRIQSRWEKDIPGFIKSADEKWPALLTD